MKPNLFIVGAPKCGTTAWVDYLKGHPGIFFSPIKEPFHFCEDWPAEWRMTDRAEYLRLFENAGDAKAIGEASVWYLNSEVAAEIIKEFNPEARIIIFLREQEKMLPSWHNQMLYSGRENLLDFGEAWRLSGNRDASNLPARSLMPRVLDYKATGRFSEQIDRYIAAFPVSQVRVFHFRNWAADPRSTYLEILRFLGLEDDGRTDFAPVNEAKHHKFGMLGRFTQYPPPWALKASRIVKRLTGRSRPPFVGLIRKINTAPGYRIVGPSPDLVQEIQDYYRTDNAKVESIIAKIGAVGTPHA